MLRPDQRLGPLDPTTKPHGETDLSDDDIRVIIAKKNRPHINSLINLADMEDVARKVMSQQAWHYYRSDAEDGYSASGRHELLQQDDHQGTYMTFLPFYRLHKQPRLLQALLLQATNVRKAL